MASIYRGTCLCGQTAFAVHAEPIRSVQFVHFYLRVFTYQHALRRFSTSCCHCTNCKKYTGTVFTTNLVFPADVGILLQACLVAPDLSRGLTVAKNHQRRTSRQSLR